MDVKGTTKSGFLDLEKGTASESSELCTDHTEMSHQYLHQETQFLTCDESTICGGSGGDIYDVVGAGSTPPSRTVNPFSSSSGEMAAAESVNVRGAPFTEAQWQELERQTIIYKYLMASVPVPSELLIPIITKTTTSSSSVPPSSISTSISTNTNKADPEPWRCKRTDGKKWRCSRDVAPDQKYCERHSHKTRPRSRKPVELNADEYSTKRINFSHHHNYNNMVSATQYDQPRGLEWLMRGESISTQEWQQMGDNSIGFNKFAPLEAALNANQAVETQTRETRHFIDEIDHKNSGGYGAETERFSMNSSSSGGLWMGGSAPGGPLAEALCLGIASSSSNNSKCSSSGDGDQLGSNSIN
ncbi:growth-regulating factor 8-like [Tripterygium wilfordii]|uniref:growth-regulating factor 8-like n=1 Tax=Tripterygium wilfordii TaxID=458696 RepID=UPI0018F84527|nr:growth-regulating factor 8-like [Tripterygium wilfordii]